jgi:hypothetical protein
MWPSAKEGTSKAGPRNFFLKKVRKSVTKGGNCGTVTVASSELPTRRECVRRAAICRSTPTLPDTHCRQWHRDSRDHRVVRMNPPTAVRPLELSPIASIVYPRSLLHKSHSHCELMPNFSSTHGQTMTSLAKTWQRLGDIEVPQSQ